MPAMRGRGCRRESLRAAARLAVPMVLTCLALASAADWPQWRGPARDGAAPGAKLPDPWPASLKKLWELEVGLGYASPVVAGGKLVQLSRQGDDEVVQCLDAAGNVLWRDAYPAGPFQPQNVARRHGLGPFSTPTLADGKAFTLGISGVLSGYDLAEGKLLWRKTFAEEFKKPYPIWGAANSPLVDSNLCILGVGSKEEGGLAAINATTGQEVWRLRDDWAAYTSPQIAAMAGYRQVVTMLENHLVGVDLKRGERLWQVPFHVRYEMNIITPVIHGDLVVYSGHREPTIAVRIARDSQTLKATEVWQNAQETMFMSSPVRHGEHIYGLAERGRGTLVCISLAAGKTAWASLGGMGDYASLVRVDDKLLVMKANGELLVVAADPSGYKELGRSRLTQRPVYAHLAVTGDRLYVKDKTHLLCFALTGE